MNAQTAVDEIKETVATEHAIDLLRHEQVCVVACNGLKERCVCVCVGGGGSEKAT
jgi:hypothetical protein